MVDTKNNRYGSVILPDWLGSGHDLFGTIQIIKGKKIQRGFLEIDFEFKFSEKFNYPIVFEIKSVNSDIEAYAVAFQIDGDIEPATRAIEENIIAPRVCRTLRRSDFVKFFAEVVANDVDFALYINKVPKKFKDIKLYNLTEEQKIILNERLIMEITEVLDREHSVQN